MSVYIVTHKKYDAVQNDHYETIQVGTALHDDLGYLRDDIGDNISDKNPNYCELTALYYLWKNTNDPIIGLCHYRRFFVKGMISEFRRKVVAWPQIQRILGKCDVVLPVPECFDKLTIYNQIVTTSISEENISVLRTVVKEKYPEYLDDYDHVMNRNWLSCYNMLITQKTYIDTYCQWLFDILFEMESRIDLSQESEYRKRIFGFLGERLLNVWVRHNHLKIKYLHVMKTDEPINAVALLKKRVKYPYYRLKYGSPQR